MERRRRRGPRVHRQLFKTTCPRANAVHDFITRHASKITGVLKGFDRLLFRGYLTRLSFGEGVEGFLRRQGVMKKNFGPFAETVTAMIPRRG